ncbi:hypothetical protein G6F65_010914 [Rhizopus arrhizus]|nr:hypothetical protein G6F65_010914 [Rhizopus arrhizus]
MQAHNQSLRRTQSLQFRAQLATGLHRFAEFSRPGAFIADAQFLGHLHRHHPLRLQPPPTQVLQRGGVGHP